MNEVPDLTAKLSMLPSNSLQQFAQLHKGDPYIMALVMSESNRRKKLQQAGMQPQGEAPKVVDQMISSLALPEERGIAQLPTPNMANMADGGIAGYSDDEEGYAAGGVPGYAGDEDQGQQVKEKNVEYKYVRDASGNLVKVPVDKANKKPGVADMLKAVSDFSNRNAGKPPAPPTPPAPPAPPAPPEAPTVFQTPDRQGSYPGGSTPPPAAPPPAPGNVAPQARPPAAAPAAAAPGITAIAPAPMTASDAMNAARQFTNVDAQNITSDLMAKKARVGQENEQNLADYQKGLGALPEAYKGYEERLKAQEAGAGKEKEDAQGMAIFKAGLAMMSGSSPNALQNIGKGALAGAEDYQGALKDLKKAAQERDKAFADIENARLAFKRDDMKTYQALKERGQDRLERVDDKMIDFTSSVLGWNARDATQLYTQSVSEIGHNQRSANQIKSNERIAGNQIANQLAIAKLPGGQERFFATLDPAGKGNVGAGFKVYTDATSEGRGDQTILAAFAKDPNLLATLKDTDPMLYKSISERLRTQMAPLPPALDKPTGTAFK
jgi:tetratricopeptide (TPR) repeat protein